ncbi:MAG: LysM peptidoglycan-binding domain-containing protein, partial [Thiobacillus sp.]|nr:LysM peptidoglycan-binding domain-containing protein [Thiobacillus sp.]
MRVAAGGGVRVAAVVLAAWALSACTASGPAPVSDRSAGRTAAKSETPRPATTQIAPSTNGRHTVQRGDTLYAIAFANGLDHREIALWNGLESAGLILVGQVLGGAPPPGGGAKKPPDHPPAPRAPPR